MMVVAGLARPPGPLVLEQFAKHELNRRHRRYERTWQPWDRQALRERWVAAVTKDLKVEVAAGRVVGAELNSPHCETARFLVLLATQTIGRPQLDDGESRACERDLAIGVPGSDRPHLPFAP